MAAAAGSDRSAFLPVELRELPGASHPPLASAELRRGVQEPRGRRGVRDGACRRRAEGHASDRSAQPLRWPGSARFGDRPENGVPGSRRRHIPLAADSAAPAASRLDPVQSPPVVSAG
ncbi:MAG: hypothetical protein H6917_15990 [Novosphingobium sp.]|nr:hypothetical protein [Novosphingobium sp.]MCP5403872.1 hypothetical protein [Novosphingobium sp.]